MKRTCFYCKRSGVAYTDIWPDETAEGDEIWSCTDNAACADRVAHPTTAVPTKPADQVMRALGAAELPGLWEAR